MQRYVSVVFFILVFISTAAAQSKLDSVVGAIIEIDKTNKTATLKTDSGESVKLTTDASTACLRIPAGERTLSKAEPIKFDDISIADRILAHGSKTNSSFTAQRLIVMPAAEVAKKREHDLDEWKQRGVGGVVREVNAQTGEITLDLRGTNTGRLSINTTKASFRRYVAGSLRFEDARSSGFAEVRVGDQLRALGDQNGGNFVAEQIVSGAFKTVGVTVVDVDQQRGEIHAITLDQKKPITIQFNKDSVLHRISPPVAAAIAQKAKGDAAKPATTPAGAKPAQPVIDVQQMIDTLPGIALTDLKAGDVLAVTGAIENDDSHLVAIKVAAGVDLVLKALAPAPGKPQSVRLSAGLPPGFDFSVIPVN
ncbi:MAG TPA: hypothetical protein VE863_04625 [Pyrinomonadaceae bacterium]|jgi:hypothetical protein|nr:hypothetical protein [Pyrinomonadaceae bacterium]